MKKESLIEQLGWTWFWLTIIVTAFGSYLKITGEIKLAWWWVTVPVWGSIGAAALLLGVCWLILKIWGSERLINADYTEEPKDL